METQINPKRTTFRAKNLERRVLLQMTLSKNWRTFGKRTRKTPSLFSAWFSTVEIDPSQYCVWNATNHITSNKHPHQVLDKSRPGIPGQTCNIGPPHIPSHMDRIHTWRPGICANHLCAYHPHKPHFKAKILWNRGLGMISNGNKLSEVQITRQWKSTLRWISTVA